MAAEHHLKPVDAKAVDIAKPIDLVMHVGLHKTGSTSIQVGLGEHYERLLSEGVLYPVGIFPDRQHSSLHRIAAKAAASQLTAFFLGLRDLANRKGATKVILSGEMLSMLAEEPLRRLRDASLMCNFQTTVVGFTREGLGLLRSQLAQLMSSHPTVFVTPSSFARHVEARKATEIERTFADVFGSAAIFHALQPGEDAVAKFAGLAGIQLSHERRRNASVDFAVASLVNAVKADIELSPASVHRAFNLAFGERRRVLQGEDRFLLEAMSQSGSEVGEKAHAELVELAQRSPAEWTHAEQARYLRDFERFVRYLRRDHAWAIKGRVRGRRKRMDGSVERFGVRGKRDGATRSAPARSGDD